MPNKKDAPQPLLGEQTSVFRLRLVLWILQQHPGEDYEAIRDWYSQYAPKPMSKESIVRSVKLLEARGQATWEGCKDDHRARFWYAVA